MRSVGLISASGNGHLAVVQYLVEQGADVNIKDNVKMCMRVLCFVYLCALCVVLMCVTNCVYMMMC